jgi:hypothetical protein
MTITSGSGYSGNDRIYARVYVKGPSGNSASQRLYISEVQLGIGGASQHAEDSLGMPIPGASFAANTPLILDVNGNTAIGLAVMRASGNIFYSMP